MFTKNNSVLKLSGNNFDSFSAEEENMKLIIALLLLTYSLTALAGNGVKLSIIKTGYASSYEWLTLESGDFKKVIINHSAFLIEHPKGNILVDTGLGEKVDEQFKADMPFIHRIGFAYEKGESVRTQLAKENIDFAFLLLTHLHFDHVSGLVDFPAKDIWALPEEIAFKDSGTTPGVLKSQVSSPDIKWRPYSFQPHLFMGFSEGLDVYNDQSVVIVPLRGHTPGSVGIIVTTESGKKIFLVGDTVWSKKGIDLKRPKSWLSSRLVDLDKEKVQKEIELLHDFQTSYPDVILMPSHDQSIQEPFGYFPKRIE
jgi:glyoxylase-like metal-dependent hydrolase (beta-lactamase superfamily II)